MFQYAYYLHIKELFGDAATFIPSADWEHEGGFELSRVFGLCHTETLWESLYHKGFPFTRVFHLFHKTYLGRNFRFSDADLNPDSTFRYFYGTWQSERYLTNHALIRDAFSFDTSKLSDETSRIANSLGGEELTCSIHIRRGDYLSAAFSQGYGNCCTLDYYQRAIDHIRNNAGGTVTFYVFSDDIEWVRNNLKIENARFVNHNRGTDSWQDMYLMSICDHNIIANSTFSWWGAWLNENADKIVVAPKRWWSSIENDDVVPDSWIRL